MRNKICTEGIHGIRRDESTYIFYVIAAKNMTKKEVQQNVMFMLMLMWKNHQKQSHGGVCKKGVLRNFAKFTGKHLHQSLFFKKVAGFNY